MKVKEIKGEIKIIHGSKWKWNPNSPSPSWCNKGSSKREEYHNSGLSQEERRSQTHNLTLYLKELEKEHQVKPKASILKEIIKNRGETNDIETNKQKKNSRTDQWN